MPLLPKTLRKARKALKLRLRAAVDPVIRMGYRRKLRLFVVGLPKTGTTSLTRMFRDRYRAGHELGGERFLRCLADHIAGRLPTEEMRGILVQRIGRIRVDVDSAAFLSHFAGFLADRYPDAKFVITLRDCYSWLRSVISHMATRPARHRSLIDYRDFKYGGAESDPGAKPRFAPEEKALEDAGLYPVQGFLKAWASVNADLLDATPPDRRLVLKTEDIGRSIGELAAFCGVEPATISLAHSNRTRRRWDGLTRIPGDFVRRKAEEICGPLMERLYGGDWQELYCQRWERP
jgi:hypothetical protein